jgi:hypothetical protein
MSISIKIANQNDAIKAMQKALAKDINLKLKKNRAKIELKIKTLVESWIRQQPEIASISQESIPFSLNAQFGFFPGTSSNAVDSICSAVADAISVELNVINDKLEGGIIFYFQPDDFKNLLDLPEANIQTISANLPWLDWLLNQGTRTIVSGYEYKPDNSGRSGGGKMVLGKAWRIPPEFAGNSNNNFITRALENKDSELLPILQDMLYG